MKSSLTILYTIALIGATLGSGNALEPAQQSKKITEIKSLKETLMPFSRMMKAGYRTSTERAWEIESMPYSSAYITDEKEFAGMTKRATMDMINNMTYLDKVMENIENSGCLGKIPMIRMQSLQFYEEEDFENFFRTTRMDLEMIRDRIKRKIKLLESNPTMANAQSLIKETHSKRMKDLDIKLMQCMEIMDEYMQDE